MKKIIPILSLLCISVLSSCGGKKEESKEKEKTKDTSKVVVQEVTKADTVVIYKYVGSDVILNNSYLQVAPEAIKSILAYYCFQFNTGCPDKKHCKLTEALGLGEQNSKQHQDLVLKWFKDEDTKLSIANGGSVKPTGSDSYAWFMNITLIVSGKTVKVNYVSSWINKNMLGKGKGNDEYLIGADQITVVGRNHVEADVQ